MKKLKEVFYIVSLWDDSILVDNIERENIQAALNEATTIQRGLGLYRDKPTFKLTSKSIEVNNVQVEN